MSVPRLTEIDQDQTPAWAGTTTTGRGSTNVLAKGLWGLGKNIRNGETQKQRKTRRKRLEKALAIYSSHVTKPESVTNNVARALRRHPPTTCALCGVDLLWDAWLGRYAADDDRALCQGAKEPLHTPANGKRRSRWDGDRGGPSRDK